MENFTKLEMEGNWDKAVPNMFLLSQSLRKYLDKFSKIAQRKKFGIHFSVFLTAITKV